MFLILTGIALSIAVSAQVDIDKPINMIGVGSDAQIEGIKTVDDTLDATNVESIQKSQLTYAAAGGSSSAYTVSTSPSFVNVATGTVVHFMANHAATGATTLDLNGTGAAPIKKNFDQDLVADDIKNGQIVTVMFDGTNWQMLSQLGNASSGGGGGGGSGSDPNTLIYTVSGF